MIIRTFFDARTWTLTHVVADPATRDAVIIDPVLDFDPATGRLWHASVDAVSAWVEAEGLRPRLVLETHAHADHLSASQVLKQRFGAPVGIGAGITAVQTLFAPLFDLAIPVDGSQFDLLLADRQVHAAGSLSIEVFHTPGHTPACVCYRIGDAVFAGDALFMPDYGVGRCDFPGGDAYQLWESVQRIYALPLATRVFVGHDYQPGGRSLMWETTIGESRSRNLHIRATTPKADFAAFRQSRDATLTAPRLLLASVQVNIDAGRLPGAHANGRRYLVLPLDLS